MIKKVFGIFRLKREEVHAALVMALVLAAMNALAISKYYHIFYRMDNGWWGNFMRVFQYSGYDCLTYAVLNDWHPHYNVYRHPLLAFMLYPLSALNEWVIDTWHTNPAQIVIAPVLIACAVYSFVFLYRILREIVGLRRFDATLLSAMLFSFAYVMLAALVPDHFIISQMLLLLTFYISGKKMLRGSRLTVWQTILLFTATAGVTLSNGIKVFVAGLFVNGRRFFRPAYFFGAVLGPAVLIWGFARWEYRTYSLPGELKRAADKERIKERTMAKIYTACADTAAVKDSALVMARAKEIYRERQEARKRRDSKKGFVAHVGKPAKNEGFWRWTDVSTPRMESVVENMFGESIQLHRPYLMQDTLRWRPVIVAYDFVVPYIVEALLVLLFLAGVWIGRKSRFLWMCLTCFAFDVFVHVVLGFGLNEIYIMAAHWLYVIPVAAAFLFKSLAGRRLALLRGITLAVVAWLYIYNVWLMTGYFLEPVG